MKRTLQAVQFHAPEGAEVNGIILLAYLNNLDRDITEPILEQYGFSTENMNVDHWYPNQMFLDIEQAIHQDPGGSDALVAIGKSAADNYIPPDGVESFVAAIEALPSVYTTNQRNLPDGYGWMLEKRGAQHYIFTNNTGTSNHATYGYVWALCERMKPIDVTVNIIPLQGVEPNATEPLILEIKW